MSEPATAAAPDPTDPVWAGASPARLRSGRRPPAGPLALFASVVFANAALLFTVEPLFGKLVLPLLGGTSAVWSTCMMFYQGVLLGGYLYAHFGDRLLGARAFAGVHLVLFALACATLPIQVAAGWTPPTTGTPVPWLLGLLAVSLGLPFFVLSAGAPLLQRWYADVGPPGADPYVLYAASNAGSLVALLAYPALLEPLATLRAQSRGWSVAFVLLALLFGACALRLWRVSGSVVGGVLNVSSSRVVAPAIGRGQRPRWLVLSAIPSSLLLGTTSYLTTDIAPVPLLWVVPLALYLITFIVAYGAGARRVPDWLPRAARLLLIPTVLVTVLEVRVPIGPTLAWTLATFVAVALVCHLRLAAERPAPAHLTEYYAWISLGGLLGSAFNVLVAPGLFDAAYEYPLALVAALVLIATTGRRAATPEVLDRSVASDVGLGAATVAGLGVLVWAVSLPVAWTSTLRLLILLPIAAVALLASVERPLRVATVGVGLVGLLAMLGAGLSGRDLVLRARSFYGVYQVTRTSGADASHQLMHGSTLHGLQRREPTERRRPLSYYARSGPVGDAFEALPPRITRGRVAAVGLGSGSLACYALPGSRWTLLEIDPLIARIARDTALFSFLGDCAPDARVVLGDARRALEVVPDQSFDLLLLDAFTSDAIPVHLLTLEALRMYASKLAPDGVMLIHVSNQYLDLKPVVGGAVHRQGWVAHWRASRPSAAELREGVAPATWIAVAPRLADLGGLPARAGWTRLDASRRLWTDDYSNLLGVLRR